MTPPIARRCREALDRRRLRESPTSAHDPGRVPNCWIKQAQTFTAVMQMFVFPMFFLSGALYPVSEFPTWLGVLTRIVPLTCAVDAMRRTCTALGSVFRPRVTRT